MVCPKPNQVSPVALAALESFLKVQGITVVGQLVELGGRKLKGTLIPIAKPEGILSLHAENNLLEALPWGVNLSAVGIPSEMAKRLEDFWPSWGRIFVVAPVISGVYGGNRGQDNNNYVEEENGGLRMTIHLTGTVQTDRLEGFLKDSLPKMRSLLTSNLVTLMSDHLSLDLGGELSFSVSGD